MTNDDRDFIERAESMTRNLNGDPATSGQIADNFALYGLKKRAAALHNLDAELRGDFDSSPQSLRRRLRLVGLRQQMGDVHDALRKAGR